MHKRRGRTRKIGPRHKNGHLRAVMAESPRERAAHMPHRRGLGDNALDAGAECELGRMRLRGQITEPENTAGEVYARMWRGYVSTLNAPHSPGEAQGRVSACSGCPSPESRKWCLCDMRRRIWDEAVRVLATIGAGVIPVVHAVVILDKPCGENISVLRLGLSTLAEHYGLTNHRKGGYRNARSPKHVETVHR